MKTIKDFFKENKLQKTVQVVASRGKCYQDSETHIQFVELIKELKDTHQSVLVLSRTLAEAISDGKYTIADAMVTYSEENETWGLICPRQVDLVGEAIELW